MEIGIGVDVAKWNKTLNAEEHGDECKIRKLRKTEICKTEEDDTEN